MRVSLFYLFYLALKIILLDILAYSRSFSTFFQLTFSIELQESLLLISQPLRGLMPLRPCPSHWPLGPGPGPRPVRLRTGSGLRAGPPEGRPRRDLPVTVVTVAKPGGT